MIKPVESMAALALIRAQATIAANAKPMNNTLSHLFLFFTMANWESPIAAVPMMGPNAFF